MMNYQITNADIHTHLRARMSQRGVSIEEIQKVLDHGWQAKDAKQGTLGKVLVFPYAAEWEGQIYSEKEVTVYYKVIDKEIVLLTVKARYGQGFMKG
ncbi:MAG: hypothetical protein AB1345_12005 [Chloroflexota bacterium]